MKEAKKKRLLHIFIWIGVILIGCGIACGIYLNDYYHADKERIELFIMESPLDQQVSDDGDIAFVPEKATKGFIFYPGGKVEYTAYIPLMNALASKGILCVLTEMPFNLAVFDMNAAEGIQDAYPQIKEWYIGGHSLGGSMAASHLSEHAEDYEGLILMGSYSTADLSETDLDVLSVYGSEDGVMNREKYDENVKNLPKDFAEVILDGGCHAYYGMYGEQDGDGTATMTDEEQIEMTAEIINEFVNP